MGPSETVTGGTAFNFFLRSFHSFTSSHGERQPARGAKRIRADAEAGRKAGKFIEQQHWPAALGEQFGKATHVAIKVGSIDLLNFARIRSCLDEIGETIESHSRKTSGLQQGGPQRLILHCRSRAGHVRPGA
jgi:hypothetical protein